MIAPPGDQHMKIVTSLSFKGQCREAFEFHGRILGGKITAAVHGALSDRFGIPWMVNTNPGADWKPSAPVQ
jgi:uncharacterized glyoxalase superfamily protein PhnB